VNSSNVGKHSYPIRFIHISSKSKEAVGMMKGKPFIEINGGRKI
jgi:hypothetical protein